MKSSSRGQQKAVKWLIGMMGLCTTAYIVGPPLYWHLSDLLAASSSSSASPHCPPCFCDCSPLSLPHGLSDMSFTDCMKHDPEVSIEMEQSFTDLLAEEVKVREAEALGNQQLADVALLEAKKLSSQYQKDADKCNAGMETCEEARENAEDALESQRKLSAMWEIRARQRGWREGITKISDF